MESISEKDLNLEELEEYCGHFETTMNTIDSGEASILSKETRTSFKSRYLERLNEYKSLIKNIYYYSHLLEFITAPVYEDEPEFDKILFEAKQELNNLYTSIYLGNSLITSLFVQYKGRIEELTEEVIKRLLPIEYRDSIDLIEKTLKEPEFFTLPHLIMWKETAEEKIRKIWERKEPTSIATEITNIYRALIKRLKAEILKLRTYPIPEPWCSFLMREKQNHIVDTEFVFFVCPEVDEDMKPLVLSKRDKLPGGLSPYEYNLRLGRMGIEFIASYEDWEDREEKPSETTVKWFEYITEKIKNRIAFSFQELSLLYRDGRTLEYLVNKNEDDKLLKEIWETLLRSIRHFYYNRIDIPSVAISYADSLICIAPPTVERNLPVASGVDRGAIDGFQLVTPAAIFVFNSTVIVADKCGHLVSWYRREDLESIGYFHLESAETPVSMGYYMGFLCVCYSHELALYKPTWGDIEGDKRIISGIQYRSSIRIPLCCCTANNNYTLYVGSVKPSLIIIEIIGIDSPSISEEYQLNPIRYQNKNIYPWLQDMKVVVDRIICLFTGSPYPIQMFTLEGKFIRSVVTADQISGAYHFNVFFNAVTKDWLIYVTDFWENVIKVFDMTGDLVDTYCEKGNELCQLIHPTGIFIELSGYINVCDMKEDNCL